jgi:integrase
MPKRERGEIRVHQRLDGQTTYSLRFRVGRRRQTLTLGTDTEGWTYRKAEHKLEDVLAQVRAGVWQPPRLAGDNGTEVTFHEFASEWTEARKGEVRANTHVGYEWALRKHLLPFFAGYVVSDIDVRAVDAYREHKLAQRERIRAAAAAGRPSSGKRGRRRVPISNSTLNKTLRILASILDSAVERQLLATNPARGKRRRLKVAKPARPSLERDELAELIAVAELMDRAARLDRRIGRRTMIAVMAKTGLRVTELCELRWSCVDLKRGQLVIRQAKTDAGRRDVDLTDEVIDALASWRAERDPKSLDELVFPTALGTPRNKDNVRKHVLAPVIKRATELRTKRGALPFPAITPHALRRTYISLMLEAGAPVHYVMGQVGHEDSKTTLEIYAQVQKRLSRKSVQKAFDALLADAGESRASDSLRRPRQDVSSSTTSARRTVVEHRQVPAWSTLVVHAA